MTATEARRDLPDITVRLPDGKTYTARVTGRLNQFATATVAFVHQHHRKHLRDFGGLPWIDQHFTWEQIARSATTGEPLSFA